MIKKNLALYKKIFKEIKKAATIVIFRHEAPDFDALGSQFGLATWLKNSFPSKKILLTGSNHVTFTPRLYPEIDVINDEDFPKDFLAIVLDTSNIRRIDDKRYANAKTIVKFDHHPLTDDYASISIINEELSSCAELVADFIFTFEKKYPLSKLAASYLYSGIVGDSGRFLFPSVNATTLRISAKLIETGFDISKDVYLKMYQKTYQDLVITKHVLNSCVFTDKGVAYYVLKDEDLKALNIPSERGKENLSLMRDLEDIEVWFSVTEDVKKEEFRLSIRSKRIPINDIAASFGGGGHDLASGGKLKSLDELDSLVVALQDRVQEYLNKYKVL